MSFILQDKNILNLIYKMAQEEAMPAAVDEEVINELFDNLFTYSPSKAALLTGGGSWKSVKIHNLSSLESLLTTMKDLEIKIGDKPCVDDNPRSGLDADSYGRSGKFYVNKEGLKIYIKDILLRSPSYERDPLYRALLGYRIKEANDAFRLGIEVPEPSKDQSIFKFKNIIDLDKNLSSNKGEIDLFVSNLDNLKKWTEYNSISISKSTNLVLDDDKACAFLRYLYARPELTSFKSNIGAAANKINCTLPSAPASGETATQTGKAEGPGGLGFLNLNLIYVEMSKDHAPYYEYYDGVIFEMSEKGIIPFLTKLSPLAERANLTDISAASQNLLRKFETFRTNILGINVLKSTSRSPNMTRQLGELPFTRRSPIAEASKNNLISLIEQLHDQVVLPLCEQLRLNSNDFEVRKGFKISNITSAFTEILAAANAEHPS
jgi:hypothetical protein